MRERVCVCGCLWKFPSTKLEAYLHSVCFVEAWPVPWLAEQDVQLVMLGSGRSDLENALRWAESAYRTKVRGWVGFSVDMAHKITAARSVAKKL